MKIKNSKQEDKVVDLSKKEKEDLAYLMGENAFKDSIKISEADEEKATKHSMEDPEIVFEYLYLGFDNKHPEDDDLEVRLEESDRSEFINGFETAQQRYYLGGYQYSFDDTEVAGGRKVSKLKMSTLYGQFDKKNDEDDDEDDDDDSKYSPWWYSRGTYAYTYKEPTFIYERFNKIETSTKEIIFPEELSKLFWDIFQTASGKEIMFYGEISNSEEKPDTYVVTSMNFPPQKNYGGYVETVDGDYEMWAFNEIIRKGRKVPLHVHTHPDFSAFSSSVDEKQIKQYIEDNAGNPFVIQLIVSNPRKGTYFIRWFDLVNNTWERPLVKFTYQPYDVEANYPGIFQFNAPRTYPSEFSEFGKTSESFKKYQLDNTKDDEEDLDEDDDIFEKENFDKWFIKKYGNIKI